MTRQSTDPPPNPSPRRRSVIDLVVTALLGVAALFVALFAAWCAVWFGASTMSCDTDCNLGALNAAWIVAFGGVVTALVVMAVGTVWAVVTRRLAFWWPLASIVITVLCFSVGVLLVEQVDPN